MRHDTFFTFVHPVSKIIFFPAVDLYSKFMKYKDKMHLVKNNLSANNSSLVTLNDFSKDGNSRVDFFLSLFFAVLSAYASAVFFAANTLLIRLNRPNFIEISRREASL